MLLVRLACDGLQEGELAGVVQFLAGVAGGHVDRADRDALDRNLEPATFGDVMVVVKRRGAVAHVVVVADEDRYAPAPAAGGVLEW